MKRAPFAEHAYVYVSVYIYIYTSKLSHIHIVYTVYAGMHTYKQTSKTEGPVAVDLAAPTLTDPVALFKRGGWVSGFRV